MDIRTPDTVKTELLEGMTDYMNDVIEDGSDPGYVQADVDKCGRLVDTFLEQVRLVEAGHPELVMPLVERVVMELNALNEKCDGMIETEQREQLCELISLVAFERGVGNGQDDLTEDWREW